MCKNTTDEYVQFLQEEKKRQIILGKNKYASTR
jgi:hypothetical protein